MPRGVDSTRLNSEVETALAVEGDDLRTTRALWTLSHRVRMRVADAFIGRAVVIEVWPNRDTNDEANHTVDSISVLSAAFNPTWGPRGTAILIVEFEEGLQRADLPIPMSMVRSIRTVD